MTVSSVRGRQIDSRHHILLVTRREPFRTLQLLLVIDQQLRVMTVRKHHVTQALMTDHQRARVAAGRALAGKVLKGSGRLLIKGKSL